MYNLTSLDNINIIEIEGSSFCNAGCPYCARHLTGTSIRDTGFTQTHVPFKLIEKLKTDFGKQTENQELWFVGNLGDALMNPEIDKMWHFGLRHFDYIEIETNGGLRTVDYWKHMGNICKRKGYGGAITFSIDGLEDTNEIYRKKVKWDKLMENVEAYLSAGGRANWKWLVFEHNEHQIDEARILAKKMGFRKFDVQYSTRYNETLYDPNEGKVEEVNLDKRGKEHKGETTALSTNVDDKIDSILKDVDYFNPQKRISCKYIKQKRMYLNAKGRIWPCCWHSAKYDKYDDLREMEPALITHYKDGFNDYNTKSMQEIFDHKAWVQMTDSWKTVDPTNKTAPFNLCARKCVNDKWMATCNISKHEEGYKNSSMIQKNGLL